jgi:hippurate hydrolase
LEATIFGRGGHGARPQTTVDPILFATRTILGFQALVTAGALMLFELMERK